MTKITLDEANKIASTYFKLLIDRHTAQGFSAQVVEKKEIKVPPTFIWSFVMHGKILKATKLWHITTHFSKKGK